jgi:Na+-transporting NADH:ubiquinone oxidoreductase subunit F
MMQQEPEFERIDQLAIGDSLSFSGPFGGFAAFDSPRELVCAAVGSGMAPIRSLLLGTAQSATRRRISYFFAARRASEIPHLAEIRALERELADFRFIPVLADRSGETSGGVSGSIAEALNRSLKRGTEIDAYICGNARFVDTCSRVLTDKGVRPEAIHSDRFTQGGERT